MPQAEPSTWAAPSLKPGRGRPLGAQASFADIPSLRSPSQQPFLPSAPKDRPC